VPSYLSPGVYLQELPSGVLPITQVGTATAAFVGYGFQGPVGESAYVTRWADYVSQFGGVFAGAQPDLMGQSVSAFFSNGGTAAYVTRATQGGWPAAGYMLASPATKKDTDTTASNDGLAGTDGVLQFEASTPGTWGANLSVAVSPRTGAAIPYTASVRIAQPPQPGVDPIPVEVESFNVSLDDTSPYWIVSVLNSLNTGSAYVSATAGTVGQTLVGVSRSGYLDPAFLAESLNATSLDVSVNGGAAVTVNFANFAPTDGLTAVANAIQQTVTAAAGTGPTAIQALSGFICETLPAGGTPVALELRSGAWGGDSKTNSSVTVTPHGGTDAAELLRLGAANGGIEISGANVLENLGWFDPTSGAAAATLGNGVDPDPANLTAYQGIFDELLKIRDINILCLPGQVWGDPNNEASQAIVSAAVAHVESAQDRMLLVDLPQGQELTTENDVTGLNLPTSTYAACYYPWVEVANPAYNSETNPNVSTTILVPPSGFAAGMWGQIDARRGVWKAPAGTETALSGTAGFEFLVENSEQDALNPLGVCCLRTIAGYGDVIWGARTLATNANPDWRYVPVRRTALMIESSIYAGIQWAVFEPNDQALWSSLRASIGGFMDGLFRSGAFQGTTSASAYFVRCGLGDTMTQDDINAGQVIVLVGFAPVKPAEFVVIQIQQVVGQQ
jgi:phage tail sheath protein FI